MKKIALVLTFGISLAAASAVRADTTAPVNANPPATVENAGCHHHHGHHHHAALQNSAVGKAMHGVFASCKTAGIAPQACGQQLATYLADFKPAN